MTKRKPKYSAREDYVIERCFVLGGDLEELIEERNEEGISKDRRSVVNDKIIDRQLEYIKLVHNRYHSMYEGSR
ncbi:hypothetical protein LCGC14_0439240 [marine sediment metagenome]|uniref:Uncharacterized protein n=1 Tax=marine sediment metagenome TaxID=412755 RepID=A0A0F9V7U4_9ZZZZ